MPSTSWLGGATSCKPDVAADHGHSRLDPERAGTLVQPACGRLSLTPEGTSGARRGVKLKSGREPPGLLLSSGPG